MPKQQLDALTAVRFFAALWVVIYHHWMETSLGAMPALVSRGYLGVEAFFVLSGFILCHVYLAGAEAGRFRYGAFLWARLARIYPLHLAVLIGVGLMAVIATLIGVPVSGHVLVWKSLPANLLMVHAWGLGGAGGWNHPSWSISAEWFAYLLFPIFAWVTLKFRAAPRAAVAAALALLATLYLVFPAVAGFALTHATVAWGALRIVPCFMLGCALYLLWRSGVIKRTSTAVVGAVASFVAVVALATLGAPDLPIVVTLGALLFFLAGTGREATWSGASRILVYLGEVSYAVYMVCVPLGLVFFKLAERALHLPEGQVPGWLLPVFVVTLVGAAMACHHAIERPSRALMRRLADRWPVSRRPISVESTAC